MRDEQLVLAAELQLDVVAGDARDGLRVEAQELADAVVLVDDVVAGPQVGEARERAAEAQRGRRPRAPAEDLRGGQQRQTEGASRRSRGARARRRSRRPGTAGQAAPRRRARGASTRRRPSSARSASPRCGNATTTRMPAADQAAQLVLGLGEAAARERRALSLEPRRRRRERVEPRRARAITAGSSSAARVGLAALRRRQVRADLRRDARARSPPTGPGSQAASAACSASSSSSGTSPLGTGWRPSVVALPGLEVGGLREPLGGRVDDRVRERLERALGEQRVRREALDLVAEELDAQRRLAGRREDVDDVAADRHLAAIVDARRRARSRPRRAPR